MIRRLWHGFVGALLCQVLPLSLLTVGWTQRLMQRETLRVWHRQRRAGGGDFAAFAAEEPATAELAGAPTWLLAPGPRRSRRRRARTNGHPIVVAWHGRAGRDPPLTFQSHCCHPQATR